MKKILEIEKIEKYYGSRSSITKAIDNISFEVQGGEFGFFLYSAKQLRFLVILA